MYTLYKFDFGVSPSESFLVDCKTTLQGKSNTDVATADVE